MARSSREVHERLSELTRSELLLLVERVKAELRSRGPRADPSVPGAGRRMTSRPGGHPRDVDDPFSLQRFVQAQAAGGTYDAALRELRAGRKTSHWMWFVFPQLAGLGRSSTAQHYAITGADEARAYLAHPVLGPRLLECARAIRSLPTDDPVEVLGSVDAQKLRSSMTLFAAVAPAETVLREVLDRCFDGTDDPRTLELLDRTAPPARG